MDVKLSSSSSFHKAAKPIIFISHESINQILHELISGNPDLQKYNFTRIGECMMDMIDLGACRNCIA